MRCGNADPIVNAPTSVPIANPRHFMNHVLIYFNAVGYTIASEAPVANREAITIVKFVSNKISKLANPTQIAPKDKSHFMGQISAKANRLETIAPITKPPWTAFVSQAICELLSVKAIPISAATEVVENHVDNVSTIPKAVMLNARN
jgi:hypothetical protein